MHGNNDWWLGLLFKSPKMLEGVGAFQNLPMVMPYVDILYSVLRKAKKIAPIKGVGKGGCFEEKAVCWKGTCIYLCQGFRRNICFGREILDFCNVKKLPCFIN